MCVEEGEIEFALCRFYVIASELRVLPHCEYFGLFTITDVCFRFL